MVSNRGELARGWYERVVKNKQGDDAPAAVAVAADARAREPLPKRARKDADDSSDDDEFGPAPPGKERKSRHGPGAPKPDELQMQQGVCPAPAGMWRC